MPTPKGVTLLIDTREKRPLLFPERVLYYDRDKKPHLVRVDTARLSLRTGDYALEGYADRALVERKGSVRELCDNLLTGDRRRALSSLHRLAFGGTKSALLIEAKLSDFHPADPQLTGPPQALCELLRLASDYHIDLFFCGPLRAASTRRKLGTTVACWLIANVFDPPQPRGDPHAPSKEEEEHAADPR